jgi:hypothetical protein
MVRLGAAQPGPGTGTPSSMRFGTDQGCGLLVESEEAVEGNSSAWT